MSGGHAEPVAEHERYMARALELAEHGRGTTHPNPLVGCLIVRDNEIIGEGWHERAGEAHAEVKALQAAGDARGATVYVTLEPCNHQGRTPPCTDALIKAGIRRIVIAAKDPNPLAGGGLEKLQEAGIDVVFGILRGEAEMQNNAFRRRYLKERPFILYKTAMTLDGKIATRTGQSQWITGAAARDLVHTWRSELDAVTVGINTVLLDDPLLTCRLKTGRSPLKVIFDSVARTPPKAKLFDADPQGKPARVIIFVTEKAPASRVGELEHSGADIIILPELAERSDISAALTALQEQNISSLLLEGGGTLAWSFFKAQAVDEMAVFIAPKLLGGSGASPLGGLGVSLMDDAIKLLDVRSEFVGEDILVSGRVNYEAAAVAVKEDVYDNS